MSTVMKEMDNAMIIDLVLTDVSMPRMDGVTCHDRECEIADLDLYTVAKEMFAEQKRTSPTCFNPHSRPHCLHHPII